MRAVIALCVAGFIGSVPAAAGELATYTVRAQVQAGTYAATGTVEAVRASTLASQVSGRISEVRVRSGDDVKVGQPLIEIEVGEADDAAIASRAAAEGAAARLVSAQADFERAQRLRAQDYISVAAMQRAEAALRSAQADAQASEALSKAARTRAAWRTVTAPYTGHVTDVWVSAGDLATPGKPLVALYDPEALRVVAQVPESEAARIQSSQATQLSLGESAPIAISAWRIIPAVDPVTHSVEVRAELPAGSALQPGQFVELLLPLHDTSAQIRIPVGAILRRSELAGVYVVDAAGAAHLRQVRLGPSMGDTVSVLSGLQGGEQVALDPVAAGRR